MKLAAACVALAACGTSAPEAPPACPTALVLQGAERTASYSPGAERRPDARIFVRGDKVIDYGRVMEVVGAIHAAGFNKVALVTEFQEARRLAGERDGAASD